MRNFFGPSTCILIKYFIFFSFVDGRYQLFGESLQIPNLQLGGNTQNVPQVHVQTPNVHLDQNGYGLGLGTTIQIPTTSIQIPSVPTIQIPSTPIQIPHVHVEVPKVVEIPQVQIQTPQIQVGQNGYSLGVVGTPIQIPKVHIEVPKVVEIPQVHIQTPQVQVGNIPVGKPVEIPQAQVEGNKNLVKVNTGVHNTQLPVGNLVDLNTAFGGAQLLIGEIFVLVSKDDCFPVKVFKLVNPPTVFEILAFSPLLVSAVKS